MTAPSLNTPSSLEPFLPHRGKMLLLSRVISYDIARHSIVTEYDVAKNCLFFDKEAGGVPAWASFEMMAQSISVIASLERFFNGTLKEANPGVILSVTSFCAKEALLPLNKTVQISVCEDMRQDSVFRYSCTVGTKSGKELCEGVITVMETPNLKSFFEENNEC